MYGGEIKGNNGQHAVYCSPFIMTGGEIYDNVSNCDTVFVPGGWDDEVTSKMSDNAWIHHSQANETAGIHVDSTLVMEGNAKISDCVSREGYIFTGGASATTFAEAMTMINRVLHRLPETEADLLDDMLVWPDNQPGAWYYLAVQEATNSHDYERKESSEYETLIEMLSVRDWASFEKEWSDANSATGGEVVD